MADPISMNVRVYSNKDREMKTATILVENKKVLKNLFPNYGKDSVLSESQYNLLQRTAQRAGDGGILEEADINATNSELKNSCTSTLVKAFDYIAGIFKQKD